MRAVSNVGATATGATGFLYLPIKETIMNSFRKGRPDYATPLS